MTVLTVARDLTVPVTQAALALRTSRERLIRQVQAGHVKGELRDGRWYVSRDELPSGGAR